VVLPEEMVKDGAVLLVYALHLVDVLSHLTPTTASRLGAKRTAENVTKCRLFLPISTLFGQAKYEKSS
jgi:hypothetical protein